MHQTLGWLAVAVCIAAGSNATAAVSRSGWVIEQVYDENHPFAEQDSADLATKMGLMDSSAFYFFRGTDPIFMIDMSTLPPSSYTSTSTGHTWLGGDTHLANVGAQVDNKGTPAFTVNDYDQGYLGQYVWDLRRMATSVVLAGRENGISDAHITTAIDTLVGAYVDQMALFAAGNSEETFQLTDADTSSVVKDTIDDAAGNARSDLLSKYTTITGGKRVFAKASDLVVVPAATYNAIMASMAAYTESIPASKLYPGSFYAVKDIRQKLGSGTGSLGKMRYYILIEGPSASTSDDVILEAKQEGVSAVDVAAPGRMPTTDFANNQGDRVALTADAQVFNPDPLIGATTIGAHQYYVHEKSPFEEDFDYTKLSDHSKLITAMTYVGQALASAHALSDQDYNSKIVPYDIDSAITKAIVSKIGLESEISAFAFAYADQVNLDWQSFQAAYSAKVPLY
jgi:uncharacterized protein (DUF2252 family)